MQHSLNTQRQSSSSASPDCVHLCNWMWLWERDRKIQRGSQGGILGLCFTSASSLRDIHTYTHPHTQTGLWLSNNFCLISKPFSICPIQFIHPHPLPNPPSTHLSSSSQGFYHFQLLPFSCAFLYSARKNWAFFSPCSSLTDSSSSSLSSVRASPSLWNTFLHILKDLHLPFFIPPWSCLNLPPLPSAMLAFPSFYFI